MHTLPRPLTSPHALDQMTRRRIGWRDVDLAMRLGLEHHAAGAVFYVLRRCDIPADLLRDADVRRAIGTTVVVERGVVSTVYRNRDVRHLMRKEKRSSRPRLPRRTLRLLDTDGRLIAFYAPRVEQADVAGQNVPSRSVRGFGGRR